MSEKVKVCLVGRGEPTPLQLKLLQKFLSKYYNTTEYEVVQQVPQLATNPREAAEQVKGCQVVFSFILHPAVIATLSSLKRFGTIEHYLAPSTVAVHTATVSDVEEAKKLCAEHGADIVNTKMLPDGQLSVRCTKTTALFVDPVVRIEATEEIPAEPDESAEPAVAEN